MHYLYEILTGIYLGTTEDISELPETQGYTEIEPVFDAETQYATWNGNSWDITTNPPQPKYLLLSYGEYFKLNHDLSVAKGWEIGQPTERSKAMTPQTAKVNIQYDSEGNETGYDLAYVLYISGKDRENHSELFDGHTLYKKGDINFVEVTQPVIDADTDKVDWSLQHYDKVGDKSIDGIKLNGQRTSVSDSAVESLNNAEVTVITKDVTTKNKIAVVKDSEGNVKMATYLADDKIETNDVVEEHDDLNINASNFPDMPLQGQMVYKDTIYNSGGTAVLCNYTHKRTEHPFSDVPYFTYWREEVQGETLPFKLKELVKPDMEREYKGKVYKVTWKEPFIALHTPDLVPAQWTEVPSEDYSTAPQWKTGDYWKYSVGTLVYDDGNIWRAKNTSWVYIKPALTGNGSLSWEWVAEYKPV